MFYGSSRKCGNWNRLLLDCFPPPHIENGIANGPPGPYRPGAMITYICSQGFRTNNIVESTCSGEPNFEWSLMGSNLPICQGKFLLF